MVKALVAPQYYANRYTAADRNNYSLGRFGYEIDKIIIHVTQGSFESAINWIQNPGAGVSWHYTFAENGWCDQHVSEANAAWHCGIWENWNTSSVGLEHAGYVSDAGMWTDAMYESSAKVAAGIIHRAPAIPNDRFGYHLWAHSSIPGVSNRSDPGRYFDWARYMELIAAFLDGEKPPESGVIHRVQSGAFGERENAERRESQLKRKGFECYITRRGKYWTVQAGAFESRANADDLARRLERAGFGAYVYQGKA